MDDLRAGDDEDGSLHMQGSVCMCVRLIKIGEKSVNGEDVY